MVGEVRRIIGDSLKQTSLYSHVERFGATAGGGKMIRARLLLRVGSVSGVPRPVLCRAAAAVEMLHAASLLHDDIVDGGTCRRGEPALWVSEGTRAAVLLGDLMVSLAVEGILECQPSHLPILISTLREMCDAEAEQEFEGPEAASRSTWEMCVSIARRKTGSLFGFAAACAGGSQTRLVEALRESGYAVGTAYQLADDLLDTCADPRLADKSLGTDAATGKVTAATAFLGEEIDPLEQMALLLRESESVLAPWPEIQHALHGYVQEVVGPLVVRFSECSALKVPA
jgi:geranylgeranyl pyrophosphate synthase